MRIRRALLAAGVAMSLLLSGCGGGGGDKTTSRLGQETKRPDPAADKVRAERINLTLADLGAGWIIDTDPTGADSDEAFDKAFDQALAARGIVASQAKTADTDSPDFIRGEDMGASSSVSVYAEESPARQEFTVAASDDFVAAFNSTFNEELRREFSEDPELRGVTFSALRMAKVPFPVLGQETFSLHGQTTLRGPGGGYTLHLHFVFIRQDRVVAALFASNSPRQFPAADLEALAVKVAQRMAP